ncbi:RHS repeat-associated core domain protein [Rhizobium leguminosarum bv. trifolii WSM597]|uniref:RHS repeat-associated core domain protein n=1 Tax=Rhizobium leguminosarum bv. trifolii WSM597 TaxID=754764 RepID=I9N1K7_RHILT|nr:RHS repeat-associated core domain-containing protein [Rhizobium leguminosarum]EJB01774.1 RHS repeat-associated core domain protein [Rhizobium leguminosarum bv. trifolii WSM597]
MKSRIALRSVAVCLSASIIGVGLAMAAPIAPDNKTSFGPVNELFNVVGLPEPLVTTGSVSQSESNALREAVTSFAQDPNLSKNNKLAEYLDRFPQSNWAPAINVNLGLLYLHDGYFSRAVTAWREAWELGRDAREPQARALVDRAVGELALLYANLGQTEQLKAFLQDVGDRPIVGSATERFQVAHEQMMLVKNDPRHMFICGPLALRALMLERHADIDSVNFLLWYRASENGTNLKEVSQLADKVKLDHQLIKRSTGQKIPVPSVVHWKVGHFAAIVGEANGRFHIRDSVFDGSDMWVTKAALDEETTGYFLVPKDVDSDPSWQRLGASDAAKVWGKGPTSATRMGDAGDPNASDPDPDAPLPNSPWIGLSRPGSNRECPLCVYNIKESSVSVSLSDTPLGYEPPIGPSMKVKISYNQREDSQPQNFNFYNVSPKWTLNWLSYVTDDPANAGANVSRFLSGGGSFVYKGFDAGTRRFAAQDDDGSILVLASQEPVEYRRLLRDGSVEIYTQSDGATAYPRRVFLSQIRDPQGNAAVLNYDAQRRLTSVTDAVGRQTTFTYGLPSSPLLVTNVTDPFGRSAKLTYDAFGRLSSITDIIGLTSHFTYDTNSLVNKLTTPYGDTNFAYTAPGTTSPPRFVQVTDPLGYKEREEWLEPAPIPESDPAATVPVGMPIGAMNSYLTYRNSFHWDKSAYVAAGCADSGGCDYTKARIRHFVHMPDSSIKGTALESVKYPLENRKWYNYPGQVGFQASINGGTYSEPIAVGRVLDDGSTQMRQYSYDTGGFFNLTKEIDPLGRTTSYVYANQIDLAAVTQTTEFGQQTTIAQFNYNGQHRPLSATGAAGQTTLYRYNTVGQLVSETNPLGQKTSYSYDGASNLEAVTNANDAVAASYTYDAKARIKTSADSEGWSVSYVYDDADRVTSITFPDGTAKRFAYERLDLVSYRDREGKLWQYQYDANRRLTKIIDPSANQTLLDYNERGQIVSLTDPKGNVTGWAYDIQGRQVSKTYADQSLVSYSYETTTSRLKSVLDALGQTKTYGYGLDGRVASIDYLNPVNPTPAVSFIYDNFFPRLASMTDGAGTTDFDYYPAFSVGALQLQTECFTTNGASGCSHDITYGYDELGRMASRTISGSGPETFQYDAIGRQTNHSSDLGAFELGYLGETPQLTTRQLLPVNSNLKTAWSYLDNIHDRRLAVIANTGLDTGQFTNFSFETTPENLISRITQTSDAAVARPPSTAQTVDVNDVNQITQVSGQAYSYDANGNLLSDGERTYSWDAENRLVGITYSATPGKQTQFRYDGLGRRIGIDDTPAGGGSPTVAKYVWCGSQLCQARDSGYLLVRSYFDEGEVKTSGPNPAMFYGVDQVGSIRRVFESATSAPAYDYDPYGVALQGTTAPTHFGYAGMVSQSDSGLSLTWYRAYGANVGRWLSRDPLGDVVSPLNAYEYVNSDPLNMIDPLGLCGEDFGAQASESSKPSDDSGGVQVAETCAAYIQANCLGRIHREFPGEYYDKEIDDVRNAARNGDATARKAIKLMFDKRFQK